MFIETEQTPNPATLKFLPGRNVMGQGTADFTTAQSAERSPLAQRLFQVDGVSGVFLGSDFVTVTKAEAKTWQIMKPAILGIIMEHFATNRPVMLDGAAAPVSADAGEDSEIVTQIKELLETRVRPAVAQDGGDITFSGFREGVVYLHMRGACAGCPSSTATLRHGIEGLLRHFCPEVQSVQAV
jgi:Fe-S cluster biogenesis protein NfuA